MLADHKQINKRTVLSIAMRTNCAPLVADRFLFRYDRDSMLSLSGDNQSEVIEAFNSPFRYLNDLLNIDNIFFHSMVNHTDLAVACDVYHGVFLCCSFFPRGVLDEILNLIESVSEGFPSYFFS